MRVRFCPSPTGTPHVGLVRTALFNWAYARHTGGTFVFRIEDTDAARDSAESYAAILDALRWLGLDWDEGPEVGGPYAPYRQSERGEIYRDVVSRLLATGEVYEAYSTAEEVEARHVAAGRNPKLGYDNHDRTLTDAQRAEFAAAGAQAGAATADARRRPDLERPGARADDIRRRHGSGLRHHPRQRRAVVHLGQPGRRRADEDHPRAARRGHPAVDTRQIALYQALMRIGVAERVPEFAHLPSVLGDGNKKLSKRDPQSNLFLHRDRGFIPEGLLNYLALLGWGIADDHDVFSLDEMVAAFDVKDVNSNPARFDQKKADALNAEHIRLLDEADFAARLRDYFAVARP